LGAYSGIFAWHGMAERHHTSSYSIQQSLLQPSQTFKSSPPSVLASDVCYELVRMQLYLTEFHCKAAQGSSHS
jgi:hypothetical protein